MARVMSDTGRDIRDRARSWLATWAQAGAALDKERATRLRQMGDDDARARARDVLALWGSLKGDDLGAELVTHQRWFAAAARASRAR